MATPFSEIYSRAIFRFADYKFLEQDILTREAILEKYLFSAKTEFQKVCKVDLSQYDRELQQFDVDLGDEEIEILSLGIAYYWLSARTLNSENLKNRLNSKDLEATARFVLQIDAPQANRSRVQKCARKITH